MQKRDSLTLAMFADENALALPQVEGSSITTVDDSLAAALMKAGDYLPYLVVSNGNAEIVKQEKIVSNRICLVQGGNIAANLEKECVVVVIAERPKAMVFADTPLSYFDVNSQGFLDTKARAGIKDSGCSAGIEFLIWVPSVNMFATLFCGSASLKKEAPSIRGYVGGKAMTCKTMLAKNAKGSWFTLITAPSSAPIGTQPDPEEFKKVLTDFKNPKSSVVEMAPADAASGRAR